MIFQTIEKFIEEVKSDRYAQAQS
ncbi:MAG: hypothetical protein IKN45_04400 [Lachnospiraceae bacterium]|nr:hypothetical protein [Lachnospiraceae bacterium]MBR3637147.1 hypothetical protein [Lachnospiraceae bacterium]